jgi:hypothetical protein
VRAAAIKYSNRSDLPTLADKLEYMFKNKLNAFATKYKAKSVEEEVSIMHYRISFCYRNNSRWLRRSLTNMRDLLRKFLLTSQNQSPMRPSRILQCPLKRSLICSKRLQLYVVVMVSQQMPLSQLKILSVLLKSISHLNRDFKISWHLKSYSKHTWTLILH